MELGGEDAGLREQIEALRAGPALPERLTGKGEAVSRLGLATGSRAARVGLSMAESTGAPLSWLLGTLRVPAVAVAGVAARERLHRLTAALGFTAAAVYLTSRIVAAEPQTAAASDLVSAPVLLSLVALLVVLPAVLVPALQAVHGIARPLNAARAAALALCGGLGAAALALASEGGGLTPEQVLLAPGAATPSETVVVFALAATAGLAALRLPLFSKAATRWLRRLRSGTPLCVLMLAVSVAVIAVSVAPLYAEIDGEWWQALSVVLALPGAPLAATWLLRPWRRLG